MGRQKAPLPSSSVLDPEPLAQEPPLLTTTENSLQPNPLQLDLKLHKDATDARFEAVRESVEFLKNQQAQFHAELLDEFIQNQIGFKVH